MALGACVVVAADAKTPEACDLVAGGGKLLEPIATPVAAVTTPGACTVVAVNDKAPGAHAEVATGAMTLNACGAAAIGDSAHLIWNCITVI